MTVHFPGLVNAFKRKLRDSPLSEMMRSCKVFFSTCEITGATCGAGTAYLSGAPKFTPVFQWCSRCSIFSFVDRYLFFCLYSFGYCIVCPSIYGLLVTPFLVSSTSSYNIKAVVVVNVWQLDFQLYVHSVPITTKAVSSKGLLDTNIM